MRKKQAELDALKAQVTPHFLFNGLNVLYRDALKADTALASSIMELSTNIRYFLKEGRKPWVTLKQEVGHIENYINLQIRRLDKKVVPKIQIDIRKGNIKIAPLLLIPFVENAFKHTSNIRGYGHPINIDIKESGGVLVVSCSNPYKEQKLASEEWENSGIGLSNVKKRLELCYPKNHLLKIDTKNGQYSIHLTIRL